jgi:hypothetical protein
MSRLRCASPRHGFAVKCPACFLPKIISTSTMAFPLTSYIEAALELACYDNLADGSFAGEIPKLKGVAHSANRSANVKANCARPWRIGFLPG